GVRPERKRRALAVRRQGAAARHLRVQPAADRPGSARRRWRLCAAGRRASGLRTRSLNMISPAQDPYASRTDRSSAIIARQDPVVYGEGKYADALSADLVQRYEQDGFLLLENLFTDRKSTRLNSSHVKISYAVFCLKKKKPIISTASAI